MIPVRFASAGGALPEFQFIVINKGTDAARGAWTDRAVLSLDSSVSGDDIQLGELPNAAALQPAESYATTIEE